MGAANIGPEFTEMEYNALMELERIQQILFTDGKIAKSVDIKKKLWESVVKSGRWCKWLHSDENPDDFYSISPERQEWLVKTSCRYIWQDPEVVSDRARLYQNISMHGIDPAAIVESTIESSMDRYFYKFNLVGLNGLL
jgi:D-tagatose-1,6-bisphosphate aldolase subunit GatZ/KbaZ